MGRLGLRKSFGEKIYRGEKFSAGFFVFIVLCLLALDLYSLGGLLPHFRPCNGTLKNSCFQIFK